jgi:hypothetical protein
MGPVVLDAIGEQRQPSVVDDGSQHCRAVALEADDVDVRSLIHDAIIPDPAGRHRTAPARSWRQGRWDD